MSKTTETCLRAAFSVTACFCLSAILTAAQMSQVAGRTVSVTLVNAVDLSTKSTEADLRLSVSSAQITTALSVSKLLQRNGIAPDSEAFAVIYELNPTLRQLTSIAPGTTLQLPRLASDSVLAKVHENDYLAMLTVDPDFREALNRSAATLERTTTQFFERSTDKSRTSDDLREDISSLGQWYVEIRRSFLRRTGPPLRRDSLVQLRLEADELNSILEAAINAKAKLSKADIPRIAAIHEDVQVEMMNYGQELANEPPKADALYKVMVNIAGANEKSIERMRIYYINYGLFKEPPGKDCDAFRTTGSGASELMRVQNYMIWAARDGDPAHPVTEPLRVKVRPWDGEPILVTLSARGVLH